VGVAEPIIVETSALGLQDLGGAVFQLFIHPDMQGQHA